MTPHRKEMLRRTFIKKGDAWAKLGLAFISLVLFTPLGEMISLMKYPLYSFPSTVFCVFGFNFRLSVVLDTEIWGSYSKNEPSEISNDDPKRIKCVYLAILFQMYTGVLGT